MEGLSLLDENDFLQIISLGLTMLIGFIPTVTPLNTFKQKVILTLVFVICFISTLFFTVAKSSSDKKVNESSKLTSDSTLSSAIATLKASDSLISFTKDEILKLEGINKSTISINDKTISINLKSSDLQKKSDLLHKKFIEQIFSLESSNKVVNEIIANLKRQKSREENYLKHSTLLSYSDFLSTRLILYNGLKEIDFDFDKSILNHNQKLVTIKYKLDSFFFANNFDSLKTSKYFKQLYNEASKSTSNLIDTLNNRISLFIENNQKTKNYFFENSNKISSSIFEFLDKTLDILRIEMKNAFTANDFDYYNLLFGYNKKLVETKQLFLLEKSSISQIEQFKLLIENNKLFMMELNKYHYKKRITVSFE